MSGLAAAFAVLLVAETAVRLWLLGRQMKAARSGPKAVPSPVSELIAPADTSRAADYMTARLRLSRVALLFEAALKAVITFGGGFAAVAILVGRLGLPEPWSGTVLILVSLAAMRYASLPLHLYRTFGIEARFGFNRTTPALYVRDLAKETLIAGVIATPLIVVVLVLMQRYDANWWFIAWLAMLGFSLAMTWAYPRFLAPLFNRFAPLSDETLRSRLQVLLERCEFTANGGLFVMDASKRSSHGNAYFTGIGRNKRIVLFDTLLEHLEGDEVEAVLAHELGHFKLHHIRQHMLVSAVQSFVAFAALGWFVSRPWLLSTFGAPVASHAMALLVFMVAAPVFSFWFIPIGAFWSRRHEYEADRFAARHADAEKLKRALVKLTRDNAALMVPDPVYSAFFDSHPPLLARIARLRQA